MDLRELQLLETKIQEAEDRWRTGDWRRALEIYCDIFSERWGELDSRTEELTAADLTILERIADLSVPFGNAQAAGKLLEVAAQGYRRLGSQYWSDLITLKRIHLAFTNHEPFEARLLFRNLSGPLARLEDAPMTESVFLEWERGYRSSRPSNDLRELFTNFYLQLGRLFAFLGRFQFALAAFQRGQELAKQMGSHAGAIEIHLRLAAAGALLENGNLLAAQSELADVSSRIEQTKHPGHYTTCLELSARVDLLHGNFGNAEQRLTQVWTVCVSQGFTVPALYAMLSLAELLVLLNRTVEAKRLLAAISSEANGLENGSLSAEVDCLGHVADARAGFDGAGPSSVLEMQTSAQADHSPGLQQDFEFRISTIGRSLDSFQARALQFQYYLGARRWLSAEKCLLRLRAFSNSESLLIRSRLAVLEAMYRYYTGDTAGALASIRVALPFFREQTLKPELWRAQDLYVRCLEKGDAFGPERQMLARQNHELLEEMGESLPLSDRALFMLNKPSHEEQELARQIRHLQDLTSREPSGRIGGFSRFYAVQKALNDMLNLAFRQKAALAISRLAPRHESQQSWPRIALWKRLFLRSLSEATLVFLVLPDSLVVLTLIWGRVKFHIVRTPRLRIRELVRAWHQTIGASRPDESNRLANLLGRELKLDEMLEELPSRVKRLVIVPDDALHGFPFSAVRVRNRYLLERFAISIAFQPEPRVCSLRAGSLGEEPLLFGVTEGDPPLPRTREQLQLVRDWLCKYGKAAPIRLNEEVSADGLAHLLQNASMAHISCHGEFVPDDPKQTGWQLLAGGHTQTFGLPRLFGLNLKRLRHVTLLSCWGADNYVLPGRWILSLPEVLWRAGAGSVTASLWEVSEDCAHDFVRYFYGALPGKRTDEALRDAQIQLMHGENGSTREPIDWAGFQLYGEARSFRV